MAGARICRWYGGKRAALSFRFDDAHPTHVDKAVPMLTERGLVGTFLINPGRDHFERYRTDWEGSVLAQGHELGDHTMLHRGARTDREAEEQIGQCADYIRQVQPTGGRPLACQRGGGTIWTQRKPYRFFQAKYNLFRAGRSMSCSEAYSHFSPARFKARLRQAIRDEEWMESHFHGIDATHLYISTPVFADLLDYAQSRIRDLWQAGMAAIHTYQQEREFAHLLVHPEGDDALTLHLACGTDPEVYNHPLTLEAELPPRIRRVDIVGSDGSSIEGSIERAGRVRVVKFDVRPADGEYTVRAKGIGAAYGEAHGPELPAVGPHPYVFLTQRDVPDLVAKSKVAPTREMWVQVKSEADRLAQDRPTHPEGEVTVDEARPSSGALRTLGLVYALTGDNDYVDRAIADIELILAANSWSHPKHNAEADLVSAEISCSLGLAYDWMHDALSEDLRERMRKAIISRGLEPIVEATENRVWWTHWYRCNWGSVIYGQAGVAALSLLAEEPRAVDWVRLCIEKMSQYGKALGTDGSWAESVSYACYAWSNATLFMDALKRVTDGEINLFDNPRLRRFPEWLTHLLVPDESGFVPFSNCGAGAGFRGDYLYRFASEYQDGPTQWIAERMSGRGSVFGFLWYDARVVARPPRDLPLAKVFEHIDWAVLRTRWEDPNAVLLGFKGGQKDWDHNHHDTNGFVLYAYGRPLITDLFYPHEIWGCETEAHNTIMVNGRDQRGTVRLQGCRGRHEHWGVVSDLIDSPWYTRFVGDASQAYEPEDVNSFVREVVHLKGGEGGDPPDAFVLFDEVDATGPHQMDWHLHTYGEMSVSGNTVTVVQDEAAADVSVV
ncbi:MAG: heparinase II/III family protein, partial [Candidatus Latescibacteria bacterium]|nr:heparinase II/III family protein [Candidatus Latescibacterota bacterium]